MMCEEEETRSPGHGEVLAAHGFHEVEPQLQLVCHFTLLFFLYMKHTPHTTQIGFVAATFQPPRD